MSDQTAPWGWLTPPAAHHARYATGEAWAGKTVGELARGWAARLPDAKVFLGDPSGATYASLAEDGEALAAALRDLGLREGDVIAFQLPNWIEAAVINLAAALGGFVINPIVSIYRDAEVRQMLADCRARLFFHAETFRNYDFAAMVDRIRPELPDLTHAVPVRAGTAFADLIEAGRGRGDSLPTVDPQSVKMILYTSGTTGRAKGVLHSHDTLARAVTSCAKHWGIAAGDAILMPSPVTHVSGYSNGLELPFLAGTRTVLMESWNAAAALDLIETYQVRGTVAATPFLAELVTQAEAAGTRLPSMRFFACGGASVPPEIVRRANALFGKPVAFRVFGSSEVPLTTLGYPDDAERAATTDGEVIDYEVRVVDDMGASLPPGAEGELAVRGPAMFMGYADRAQTADAIDRDGFFRTGDIGTVSVDGALCVTGRKKDLIIRGGENISAREIEEVLHRHPGIAEAAVVAMPHERLGEGVCAYLIAKGPPPSFAEIVAFVAESGLAPQKRPERIEYVEDLPRTAAGKVRKDQLREWIARDVGAKRDARTSG